MWLGRTLANALAGGLAFAVVGLFCGGGAGFIFGITSNGSLSDGYGIAFYGVIVGIICGVAGILIHFVGAACSRPDPFWQPFFDLTARVTWGQLCGTVLAITSFLIFEFIDARVKRASFGTTLREDAIFFCFFAPALMICGAIAGALWKRDT